MNGRFAFIEVAGRFWWIGNAEQRPSFYWNPREAAGFDMSNPWDRRAADQIRGSYSHLGARLVSPKHLRR